MKFQLEYDQWHNRVHQSDPDHNDARTPWYQLIREQIGPVANLRVLEVACGRGGFVRELAAAGARVVGCDFSATAVCVAAAKVRSSQFAHAALIQGDAQNLPFRDESFDVVISCETIEHVPDAAKALREMHRVTRPNGRLLLTTPNYANLMGLYELYAKVRHRGRKPDQPFDRLQFFPQIRRWIRDAGWKVLKTDGSVHQFPVLPGHNPLRWEAIERSRTMRKLLSSFALTYFVAAKKPLA